MTPDIYQQHDPDPPQPVVEAEAPAEKRPPGRPPAQGPAPSKKAEQERLRRAKKKAAAAAAPAPSVAAAGVDVPVAEQVARTFADLTEEQRKTREVMLGTAGFVYGHVTSKVLGFPLCRPADPNLTNGWNELCQARPDVAVAGAQWEAFVVALDAVAIKRGWYKEVPAEAALAMAGVGLAVTVGMVYMNNRAADAERKANEAKARERAEAERAAAVERGQKEDET